MATVALRSPNEKVGGLFYFSRMLDKIRLHGRGELPSDYHENLGKGFDEKCVTFLQIDYDQLAKQVKHGGGMKKFCNGVSTMDEDRQRMTFTFGTNSCANEAGTTKFPGRLNGGNRKLACPIDRTSKRLFNSLTPTKDACRGLTPADKTLCDHRQPITDHC
jgi:hypothetical protein